MLLPTTATTTHVTALLEYLIRVHFVRLFTVLVVHDTSTLNSSMVGSELQLEYLTAVQQAIRNQSQHGNIIALQWIDVAALESSSMDLSQQLLDAVDLHAIEGFITILPDTFSFLHARYYATRYAKLRMKDKIYLFLCDQHESPHTLLSSEILQFYPHHLMVVPATTAGTVTLLQQDKQKRSIIAETSWIEESTLNNSTSLTYSNSNTNNNNNTTTSTTPIAAAAQWLTNSYRVEQPTLMRPLPASLHNATGCGLHNGMEDYDEGDGDGDVVVVGRSTARCSTSGKNNEYHYNNNNCQHQHRDINFELWTQKFVGVWGNLDAQLLYAFLPNETFRTSNNTTASSNDLLNATKNVVNVEVYPNKLANLLGRTLRVGSITYIPYVVTNYVAAGSGNADPINPDSPNGTIFYVGSEAEIVKTFCQVLHCHLRVQPYGVDNWGIINAENGSWNGMLGDIYTQNVELAIGCIYNWYNDLTETSHTIARSAVTILGPAPAQYPAWRTPLMPFTTALWTFLIVMMIMCASIFYLLKWHDYALRQQQQRQRGVQITRWSHLYASETAFLEIFAVFIQQPSSPHGLRRFAARFFMATLLCATITLENTYSGQLKSLLTIPLYDEAVDTMDKWSRTAWQWAAPSIVWVQTIESSHLLKEQILARKFEIHDYDFLYNSSFRLDYGLGIERLMSGSFSFGDFITVAALDTKIVPKDDLYFDWTRAVAIRGWPLMQRFNRHVRVCMETGLFVHWEREIVAKYLNSQTQEVMLQLASGHTVKQAPQKLTIANISGALFILAFGYAIAGCVLLLELFGNALRRRFMHILRH